MNRTRPSRSLDREELNALADIPSPSVIRSADSLAHSKYVRFRSKADIRTAKSHVRFTPESGHVRCTRDVRFVPIADINETSVA